MVLLLKGSGLLSFFFFFLIFIKPEYASRSPQHRKGLVPQKTTTGPPGMELLKECSDSLWFQSWLCMGIAAQQIHLWSLKCYPYCMQWMAGQLCNAAQPFWYPEAKPASCSAWGQTQDPSLLCWARAPRENKLVLCRSWSLGFADCQNLVLLTCKMLSSILVLTWDFGSWVCELPCKSRKGKPAYWQNHHSVLEQAVRGELFVVLLFLPFSMPDIYEVV